MVCVAEMDGSNYTFGCDRPVLIWWQRSIDNNDDETPRMPLSEVSSMHETCENVASVEMPSQSVADNEIYEKSGASFHLFKLTVAVLLVVTLMYGLALE
jgi:hypothetical protein